MGSSCEALSKWPGDSGSPVSIVSIVIALLSAFLSVLVGNTASSATDSGGFFSTPAPSLSSSLRTDFVTEDIDSSSFLLVTSSWESWFLDS